MKGKMAIIGDGDSVLAFSSVGITPYSVLDAKQAEQVLKEIADKFEIIFITDYLAKENSQIIKEYLAKPYPIIISVPSKSGSNGYGMELIKGAMEKALGIDIFQNEKKDGN